VRHPNCQSFDEGLTVKASRDDYESPYFKEHEVEQILAAAREPYLTIFKIAWYTGLRGGEILGLTAKDIDFDRRVITPRKQADDRTRKLRELKTKGSKSPVAMHPMLEEALRAFLRDHWRPSDTGLLFLNRRQIAQAVVRHEVCVEAEPKETGDED
jgi:integrase